MRGRGRGSGDASVWVRISRKRAWVAYADRWSSVAARGLSAAIGSMQRSQTTGPAMCSRACCSRVVTSSCAPPASWSRASSQCASSPRACAARPCAQRVAWRRTFGPRASWRPVSSQRAYGISCELPSCHLRWASLSEFRITFDFAQVPHLVAMQRRGMQDGRDGVARIIATRLETSARVGGGMMNRKKRSRIAGTERSVGAEVPLVSQRGRFARGDARE